MNEENSIKIKPPFPECHPFKCWEDLDCSDVYVCGYFLQESHCPKCKLKGCVLRVGDDSGWNYVCDNCGHCFNYVEG